MQKKVLPVAALVVSNSDKTCY